MSGTNPRLDNLRRDAEEKILSRFRLHGWSAKIVREADRQDCIEIEAERQTVQTRIAVLYSCAISNEDYKDIATRAERIFFSGQPYKLEAYARSITVPVESLDNFFAFLVALNKRVEPDRSQAVTPRIPARIRRLTAENPLHAVIARLQQFTSETLARKLVERRAKVEGTGLRLETVQSKATGVAYSMRSALDYLVSTPRDPLNRRVLGLYYGTMALAQAEMLASPNGPPDLDAVEKMTRSGHGLYIAPASESGFGDLRVGVLANGFFPMWMKFLGIDTSAFPPKRPRSPADVQNVPAGMDCLLTELFASMPEIDDLFAEVVGDPPAWILVANDPSTNLQPSFRNAPRMTGSTYALFFDSSGKVSVERLARAGWPLAEVRRLDDYDYDGTVFRARVDHAGHDRFWKVLPTHTSPFGNSPALLFPTVGGIRCYRTIAAVALYALSIMVRYMPSAWRRIEGGDQDHYLALVKTSLEVWERMLPEHFLQSIAGETIRTVQPGSFS